MEKFILLLQGSQDSNMTINTIFALILIQAIFLWKIVFLVKTVRMMMKIQENKLRIKKTMEIKMEMILTLTEMPMVHLQKVIISKERETTLITKQLIRRKLFCLSYY